MEKRSKRKIEYIESFERQGEMILPQVKSKMIVGNYTKRYSNNLYLLAELTPTSRLLLDYMSEVMTGENVVYTNQTARKEFISFVSFLTKEKTRFSDSTVKNSIGQLSKLGFLIQLSRGSMRVNPEYFFKGNEEDRHRAIKEIMQSNLKVPTLEEIPEAAPSIPSPEVPKPQPPVQKIDENGFPDPDDLMARIMNL